MKALCPPKCSMPAAHTYCTTRLSQSAELTLALLVLRILANYSDTTFSLDDFALLANGFYR